MLVDEGPDSGLQLFIVLQSQILYIGTTFAIFITFGNTPCVSDNFLNELAVECINGKCT